MPTREDLPGTLKRSPKKAQETYARTHDSAVETYGEGERANRTAFSALKHSFEKVGDHWEPKDHKGPSDPQAARGGRAARNRPRETFGGVDVFGHSKGELYRRARGLGGPGPSRVSEEGLPPAVARQQDQLGAP